MSSDDLRRRQLEGIAAAKAAGRYTGRTPSIDRRAVRRLVALKGKTAAAKELGVSRASIYRILAETE
jgi:DNA invertase Pin-like site-specific DNA recombinase